MWTRVVTRPDEDVDPFRYLGPKDGDPVAIAEGEALRRLDTMRGLARGNFDVAAANEAGRAIGKLRTRIYNKLHNERAASGHSFRRRAHRNRPDKR